MRGHLNAWAFRLAVPACAVAILCAAAAHAQDDGARSPLRPPGGGIDPGPRAGCAPPSAGSVLPPLVDPGMITLSPGREITAGDIDQFNAKWMQPAERLDALLRANGNLYVRNDRIVWEVGDRMTAMARMYELTRDLQYLDHLCDFIETALRFRDDMHPGNENDGLPALPLDEFRNKRGLPAWGGKSPNRGGLHAVVEVVSSVYAYPIAAFARMVAEDPALQALYGEHAVRYANATLDTVLTFMPQIRYRGAGNFLEAYLTHIEVSPKLTLQRCQDAHAAALNDPDPYVRAAAGGMFNNCKTLLKLGGRPMSHNENLAFTMVLIELWRALDSPFYRQHPAARPVDAAPIRTLIPLLVSRQQRYFANRLHSKSFGAGRQGAWWYHADELPPGVNHPAEDTNHGALVMRYLALVDRDHDRLNVLPALVGEPIPRVYWPALANTFLWGLAKGQNFTRDILGTKPANPPDRLNGECDGWVNAARIDARVYHKCREVSLRVVGGKQDYLSIVNHSALLANKRYSVPPPPPPGPLCGAGEKCCERAEDGCTLCIPRRRRCP
jgi:hypothetical protein